MQNTTRSNSIPRRLSRLALPLTGLALLGAGMAAQAHDFDHHDAHRRFGDHHRYHHVDHHRSDDHHRFGEHEWHHGWHRHWRHRRDHDGRWRHDHDFDRYHHRRWHDDDWRGGTVQVWLGG